ncbi:MAG: host-nuclease inhibitor Gam family protein [Cardiobacteriaceae bacterium]|nr:host-nuclease inhibitor Gam family protein [Cardiobacteriaceae bacterium]
MSKKHKSQAIDTPKNRTEAQAWIKRLGDQSRQRERLLTEMNDQIAAITERYKEAINGYDDKIAYLQAGIQAWCEANREALCADGGKTANLITGEVSWRTRPPSVTVRGVEQVLENLHALGLERFIRHKEEINKEAMLAEPSLAATLSGISILSGREDFIIRPFEQSA